MAGNFGNVNWPTVIAVLIILAIMGMLSPRLRARITGNSR